MNNSPFHPQGVRAPPQIHQLNTSSQGYGYPPQIQGYTNLSNPVTSMNSGPMPPQSKTRAKLYLPDDVIRRVTFDRNLDYEGLLQLLLSYVNKDVSDKDRVTASQIKVYYLDEENEYILFDNHQEWSEASPAPNSILKIKVTVRSNKKQKKESREVRKEKKLAKKGIAEAEQLSDDSDVELVQAGKPLESEPVPKAVTSAPTQPESPVLSSVYDQLRSSHHELMAQAPKRITEAKNQSRSEPDFPRTNFAEMPPNYFSNPMQPAFHSNQKFAPQISKPISVQQVTGSAPELPQQPHKHEKALKDLVDMGFKDTETNSALLNKHNGDMNAVISELMK